MMDVNQDTFWEKVKHFCKGRSHPLADLHINGNQTEMALAPVEGADLHNVVERAIAYAKDNPEMTVHVQHGGKLHVISAEKDLDSAITEIIGHPVERVQWVPPPTMDISIAAEDGDLERVKELVAMGLSVNSRNDNGWPPLNRAAYRGHNEVVIYLLDQGAEIDAKEDSGFTALHLAGMGGMRKTAQLLLDRGADPAIRSREGELAVDLAIGNRCESTVAVFRRHEAEQEKLRQIAETERKRIELAAAVIEHTVLQRPIKPSRPIFLRRAESRGSL
jgi:hypothetical protein